ncbi:MAG TPA: glycosyltransferase [Myxococcota bacterium]|nr:glycosyltransferase [Myxococcota bacterium]
MRCGHLGPRLEAIANRLEKPAARANLLRAALLYSEGGIYLDTDTLTLRPFDDLRQGFGAFCGEEHIVFPAAVAGDRRPLVMASALARSAAREGLRLMPDGWAAFGRVSDWYHRAANNAVLGARPGHPLMRRLLEGMTRVPDDKVTVRFALGTHLLQKTLADFGEYDLWVAPPAVFYPLGPEISQHWFKPARRLRLDEMVRPETRVVHWYASVRCAEILPVIDRAWVADNRHEVPIAALLATVMDGRREAPRARAVARPVARRLRVAEPA